MLDLIAGPILRAYPDVGSNFWKLWPEFALIWFAVAQLGTTSHSLIGTIGTLVAVILIRLHRQPFNWGGNGAAFPSPFRRDDQGAELTGARSTLIRSR